jgi:hypothetical protein
VWRPGRTVRRLVRESPLVSRRPDSLSMGRTSLTNMCRLRLRTKNFLGIVESGVGQHLAQVGPMLLTGLFSEPVPAGFIEFSQVGLVLGVHAVGPSGPAGRRCPAPWLSPRPTRTSRSTWAVSRRMTPSTHASQRRSSGRDQARPSSSRPPLPTPAIHGASHLPRSRTLEGNVPPLEESGTIGGSRRRTRDRRTFGPALSTRTGGPSHELTGARDV